MESFLILWTSLLYLENEITRQFFVFFEKISQVKLEIFFYSRDVLYPELVS